MSSVCNTKQCGCCGGYITVCGWKRGKYNKFVGQKAKVCVCLCTVQSQLGGGERERERVKEPAASPREVGILSSRAALQQLRSRLRVSLWNINMTRNSYFISRDRRHRGNAKTLYIPRNLHPPPPLPTIVAALRAPVCVYVFHCSHSD